MSGGELALVVLAGSDGLVDVDDLAAFAGALVDLAAAGDRVLLTVEGGSLAATFTGALTP